MTSLRIAHVVSSFKIGGLERVALDLARTQRAQGHRVIVFSLDRGPEGALGDEFRAADVETRNVRRGPRFDVTLVLRLAAHFVRERIDVVHTHNPATMIYAAPAGKLARAVVVHTKHGENREGYRRRMALRRVTSLFTDLYVAVSPATADAARARRDVSERKLRVISNGIDVRRFRGDASGRGAVREELAIPPDAWVVGTVGRLASEKNQVLLVRALAETLGDRTRVVVVGDGPEAAAISRAASEAGVSPWVHLTGARADVPRLLDAFDVFALPSVSEGLPLVILEAMAAGLPIVASAVGGIPDVILDGVTGSLVPPGDPAALRARLLALAADPARARAIGSRARAAVIARHSLERVGDAYMELYEALLGAKRKAPIRPREMLEP